MTQPGRAVYTIEINENGQRELVDFEGPSGLSDPEIERLAATQLRTAQPGEEIVADLPLDPNEPAFEIGRDVAQHPEQAPQRLPDFLHRFSPMMAAGTEGLIDQGIGAVQGAAHVGDQAANLLEGAYNQTAGRLFGQSTSADTPAFAQATAPLGEGGDVGRAVGEIAGTALLTRGMGGPVTQGIGTGAIMSDAETPGEFAVDLAEGGAGGWLGDRAMRLARGVLEPAIEGGARLLRQGGVRHMTPGQALPALREFEDKAMSWPFIGPQLQQARRQGFEDFAVSIPRQANEVVRTRLPHRNIAPIPEGVTGQQAIRQTGDQLSAIYEDIVPRLSLRADPELEVAFREVGDRLEEMALSPRGRDRFADIIRNGVIGRFARPPATPSASREIIPYDPSVAPAAAREGIEMSGRQYQAADTYLDQQIGRFGRSQDPDHQMIAQGLRDIRAHMRNAVARQNGDLGRELEAVDEAWSMLVPAEQAAAGSPRGFFSPAQYRSALRSGDDRVRRRGMARGEVRGQEYAEAGMNILPSTHPNPSGTSSHEAYSLGNMRFYQGLGARLAYSPTTQNFLMRATVDRPAALDPLARSIARVIDPIPAPQTGAFLTQGATNSLFGY